MACSIAAGPTAGSGNVRIAIIALLGVPLAACGPKPLPDWAVSRHAERGPLTRIQAARTTKQPAPDRSFPGHATQSQAELLPFTPEWQAREDAFDNRLRRTMNICRGC
jgi:hypothetical protein